MKLATRGDAVIVISEEYVKVLLPQPITVELFGDLQQLEFQNAGIEVIEDQALGCPIRVEFTELYAPMTVAQGVSEILQKHGLNRVDYVEESEPRSRVMSITGPDPIARLGKVLSDFQASKS